MTDEVKTTDDYDEHDNEDEEKIPPDLSLYLSNINETWEQGVLNASDKKELQKILLNKKYHHLIFL